MDVPTAGAWQMRMIIEGLSRLGEAFINILYVKQE